MKDLDDRILIEGGRPLKGNVSIQGSKNAALPMMAASLLHRGTSVLKGCPKIADVFCMEEILRNLGAKTWWEEEDLYLDCTDADGSEIGADHTGRMRSSVVLLGAMLARGKKGSIGYPGGCVIGKRPVDMHLFVLQKLGARIVEEEKALFAECDCLQGNFVDFPKRSVGATEQGILCAVLAKGETILKNCACEPEIRWLCRYLRSMGAKMEGEGTDRIRIRGVRELSGGCMQVPPDRIVAGTYICAAGITRSEITLENVEEEELGAFLEVYGKMGGQYKGNSGKLIVNGKGIHRPVQYLETGVYPGFPTDLQSQMMAVLTTVPGESHIVEQIFEDRYKIAKELIHMGADIRIRGKEAVIFGGSPLHGCKVQARELRGGAALILGALGARGVTILEGYSFVQRGYAHICEDLNRLGASVKRIQE